MQIRTAMAMTVMLLLGCSKLTLENYNKISMGMPYDEVAQLIGKPVSCDNLMGVRSCQWGDDSHAVRVNFVSGKVLLFSSSKLQ